MKTIGVSGLTGMIGKNLIIQYTRDPDLKRSLKLIAFTRRQSDKSFLERNSIEYRQIDYRDADSFSGKLEDIDAFLHLAALTKPVTPAGYYLVNVDGTARVLDAMSRYGKAIRHFIFISSTAACGPAASPQIPITEQDPCNPISHYGKSKLRAEALVRSCSFNWTIIRFPMVFGAFDEDMLILFRFAKKGKVALFADLLAPYSYALASDVALFILHAFEDQRLFRNTYCYAYDTPITGRELFSSVRKALDLAEGFRYFQIPRWVAHPARFVLDLKQRLTGRATIVNPDKILELSTAYWLFSNSKLKRALGVETINNDRAVAETVRWYQDHNLL